MPIKRIITKGKVPVKIYTDDVDHQALAQLTNIAQLPFVHSHVAAMPDVHVGIGATVGAVIPTKGAIIPAAVGVDIGCGMNAVRLSLKASQLPDNLRPLRAAIEAAVPVGFAMHEGKPGVPASAVRALDGGLDRIVGKHPGILKMQKHVERIWAQQLGTLGGGNHFIELCLDENQDVWVMLHSGSRGIGNIIGRYFIDLARKDMGKHLANLPDRDLAYLQEGAQHFDDYVEAVHWAQDYAMTNRREMMRLILDALARQMTPFTLTREAINCLAGETMVMTRPGNRAISELCGGEHELLTSGGQWIKAPVKSFGEQRLFAVTLSRSGVLKTIYATAEHRWITRNQTGIQARKTTTELRAKDRLQSSFPPRAGTMAMDKESAARGFVYGDGSIQGRWAVANFCGIKDEAMFPFFANQEPPRQYARFKRVLHLPAEWKIERPLLDSMPNILYSWLAGYFAADGDVDRTGRPTLASANRSNLEYVRQLCTTIGIGTFGIRTRMRKGFGKVETPLYLLGLMRGDLCPSFFLVENHRLRFIDGRDAAERRGWNVVKVEPTDRVEEVFCAIVEGTHSFALEDNILTSNCHHNYVAVEQHFGEKLFVTRKGAIRAGEGDLGIIPGSMGAKSYIVRGKGEPESFCSCSHGAGRRMSRGKAKKAFDPQDLIAQTAGVECRKDAGVLDEIPGAYKDIDEVMANQSDLVEVVHTLKQVVCVKG